MGGSTSQTSTSRQQTTLPANQQANVNLLQQGIGDLYRSGGPQYFPGQNYTTPTAPQVAGRESALNYATGAGQGAVNTATQANQFWSDPARVWDLSSTPGYAGARQGILDTANQNLTENILPGQHLGGIASGALGGSRGLMADALAEARTSTGIGEALSNLDLGVAGMNMNANQAALSRAPQMFQLGLSPANAQMDVGGMQRADAAEQLQANMQRHDFQQNQLPRLLAMVQALTGTAGQYGGTVEGKNTQTSSGGSGIMQGLGTALTLASLFYPPLAPVAAGVGAVTAAGGKGNYVGTGPG